MLENWQDTSREQHGSYSTITAICKAGYLEPGQAICGLLIVGEKQPPPKPPQPRQCESEAQILRG